MLKGPTPLMHGTDPDWEGNMRGKTHIAEGCTPESEGDGDAKKHASPGHAHEENQEIEIAQRPESRTDPGNDRNRRSHGQHGEDLRPKLGTACEPDEAR